MEILIWGDNMKKQISISIFLSILVMILAWIYIIVNNETKQMENDFTTENEVSNEQSIVISKEQKNYKYFLKVVDGKIVVFDAKSKKVYLETSIEEHSLPSDVKERLKSGIFFITDGELYDFLENYSS